jgi:hypothetical protein
LERQVWNVFLAACIVALKVLCGVTGTFLVLLIYRGQIVPTSAGYVVGFLMEKLE